MPTDPNARGNSILEAILATMKKQNNLLEAQNKILDKMEKHGRPAMIAQRNPYLERNDGEHRSGPDHQEGDGGTVGGVQGDLQGGAADSSR